MINYESEMVLIQLLKPYHNSSKEEHAVILKEIIENTNEESKMTFMKAATAFLEMTDSEHEEFAQRLKLEFENSSFQDQELTLIPDEG